MTVWFATWEEPPELRGHCSFPLSRFLSPDVTQLSINSIVPSLKEIIPLLILSSLTLPLFTSSRSFTPLLSSFFPPLFQLISLGDGNKSRLARLRQTSGDVDGWWEIYRITGGVGWLIGFALHTRRITVGRCEMMDWCIVQPSLMKRGEWTWTMVLQASISLSFTSVAPCLCVPGALPELKKRPQLFFDKNKLAIAVGPVGHKHTAAKYSCHSSQLIWNHWYCLSQLKLFPSSHAVSALHAADSSDCRMIILKKKKKRKRKTLQQGKIIAMHVELKLPLFQSSLFWVFLTDSWPKMGHFFAEVEVTNYWLALL